MANGMVPYVKEESAPTFCDVDSWKEFGINKSFGETTRPVEMPSEKAHELNFKPSDYQLGKVGGEKVKDDADGL